MLAIACSADHTLKVKPMKGPCGICRIFNPAETIANTNKIWYCVKPRKGWASLKSICELLAQPLSSVGKRKEP